MGADVVNMSVKSSSVAKGETLIDTAATLNAMRPDLLVVRHGSSGAADLLARKVDCSVINAGDGKHEHPTQALLDALDHPPRARQDRRASPSRFAATFCIRRVARSNVALLTMLGAQVRLIGPPTLMPAGADSWGATVFHDMRAGLKDADVVMMLRRAARTDGRRLLPSRARILLVLRARRRKAAPRQEGRAGHAPRPDEPRRRDRLSSVADNPNVSLIETQVRMGVAVRMAVLEALAESGANDRGEP